MASERREAEHQSASSCTFLPIEVSTERDWFNDDPVPGKSDEKLRHEIVPAVSLEDGVTIRVAPMQRKCGGWDDEHFHPKLTLPEGFPPSGGIIVTLEAMARECLAVALSPQPSFELGKTYVVHFGANGNLSTVLRRRLPSGNDECVDATFPSVRLCQPDAWEAYWIVFHRGKLSAGIGRCPGKNCVGTLDDALYDQLRPGPDAVRFVGLGNSALGRGRNGPRATDLRVRNVRVMPVPPKVASEGGIPMEEMDHASMTIRLRRGHEASADASSSATTVAGTADAVLLAEYEKECAKNRARAKKFGVEYVEPPPDAFLKWSEARRLRANPTRGFVTGIDVMSADEQAKRDARKKRFEKDLKRKKEADMIDDSDEEQGNEDVDWNKEGVEESHSMLSGQRSPGCSDDEHIPVEQAWDNEELLREYRTDPTCECSVLGDAEMSLDKKDVGQTLLDRPSQALEGDFSLGVETKAENQQVTPNHGAENPVTSPEGGIKTNDEIDGASPAVIVPEKVHLFAIDWAAFKQIRTGDIMEFFAEYGPFYVEWLGDLTCNVLFEDRFSATRALLSLSQELPSPPPESLEVEKPPDLGSMGWRFCVRPIKKIANDRFGRKGTRARLLMRIATTRDVLEHRPTEWPAPPPGFTTRRVLGPGSDFDVRVERRMKRPRTGRATQRFRDDQDTEVDFDQSKSEQKGSNPIHRRRGVKRDDQRMKEDFGSNEMSESGTSEPFSQLDRGLRSSRPGFSVEQLEIERAAKNLDAME